MSALYVVAFLAICDDRDSIHSLRATLKYAARRGLRTVSARELPASNYQTIRRHDARRRIVNHTQRREEVIMTINLKKYGPAHKWLKLEDLLDKPPMRERVGHVRVEDGKYGERVVLVFEPSGKMLSLNQTSTGNLLRDFGETDDSWVGKLVEIYAGEVETKSGRTDAILVRGVTDVPTDTAIVAKAAKAAKAKSSKAEMDDEIPF
jgi:hypothetical protein